MKKLIFSILFLASSLNAGWEDLSTATKVVVAGAPVAIGAAFGVKALMKKRAVRRIQRIRSENEFKINSIGITPENTVVVLDFHDVLAKREYSIAFDAFKSMTLLEKIRFLDDLGYYILNRITKTSKRQLIPDYCFFYNGDNEEYKAKVLRLLNCFKPDENGIQLVKSLRSKGFTIFACSNIGDKSLSYLRGQYPVFEDLFRNQLDGIQHPTQQNDYINKRDQQTYRDLEQLARTQTGRNSEHIILVDDSAKKLEVAKKALQEKVIPIQFTSVSDMNDLLKAQLS